MKNLETTKRIIRFSIDRCGVFFVFFNLCVKLHEIVICHVVRSQHWKNSFLMTVNKFELKVTSVLEVI